jgi:hypothetical protein
MLNRAAWWNLMSGFLFLAADLRDRLAPGFLSISGPHRASLANLAVAVVFLLLGWKGFRNLRRSQER